MTVPLPPSLTPFPHRARVAVGGQGTGQNVVGQGAVEPLRVGVGVVHDTGGRAGVDVIADLVKIDGISQIGGKTINEF